MFKKPPASSRRRRLDGFGTNRGLVTGPGSVRDYGSSGSGSASVCAHLTMVCMGTEVSPVAEST